MSRISLKANKSLASLFNDFIFFKTSQGVTTANSKSDGRFLSVLFFRVLPAQIFLLMLTGINNMVDGLVGSNVLGTDAISTIGLYSPFQLIWVAVSTVLVVGSQVLCARYMGASDVKKTRGVFSLNLTVAVAASAFATLLSFTLSPAIADILGATPEIADDLSGYIIGRGVGLIPMVLGSQFVAFLSLEGQSISLSFSDRHRPGILVFLV